MAANQQQPQMVWKEKCLEYPSEFLYRCADQDSGEVVAVFLEGCLTSISEKESRD